MSEKRNGGCRGSNLNRCQRRVLLLHKYGNGRTARCQLGARFKWHGCEGRVSYESMNVDQIVPGAGYAAWNVWPTCWSCNRRWSDRPKPKRTVTAARKQAEELYRQWFGRVKVERGAGGMTVWVMRPPPRRQVWVVWTP